MPGCFRVDSQTLCDGVAVNRRAGWGGTISGCPGNATGCLDGETLRLVAAELLAFWSSRCCPALISSRTPARRNENPLCGQGCKPPHKTSFLAPDYDGIDGATRRTPKPRMNEIANKSSARNTSGSMRPRFGSRRSLQARGEM